MHDDRKPVPSAWITRFAHLIGEGGRVLDMAAGRGRHARYFLERGAHVTCVDQDVSRLEDLRDRAEILEADLESDAWPLGARRFDAVIVTNYLFLPLFPSLVAAVAPQGLLLYETFASGQEQYGKPRNPDHLLRPGELLEVVVGQLQVIAYEAGLEERASGPCVIQRICAINGNAPAALGALQP
jgi:SAM-dependent methyltransferase